MFAIQQVASKFWQQEQPAFVFRAEKSPNFGVRFFEQVAVFATLAEAQAWVTAQKKDANQ
jgi:hypothetical protein